MTTESKPRIKITYATLRNDNEELHALYEAGVEASRAGLGRYHQNFVDGRWVDGRAGTFEARSPIDTEILLGTFARGDREDVRDAIAAARRAQPAWRRTPWRDRLAILRRAAELISERQMVYGADMAFEVGKNRLEALGEVEEAADLIRYYAQTMEDNAGYDHPMDNLGDVTVHTRSVLRPHGVFAVISPFNFPMALAAGPISAALMAGNTAVFKPASASPLSGVNLVHAFHDAGVPDGVVNLVMGPGDTVGQELQSTPGIDGIVFTGSFEVGFRLFKSFSTAWPRPCIVEMGGKNPAIVTRSADLEEAAEGIMRSAFGFGGQKCSANSRVYVERPVHDELLKLLVEKTERITIGNPIPRENWLGPIVDAKAVARHQGAVAEARRDGTVFTGGERLTDGYFARGFYVEPTVAGLPAGHRLFQDELFAPFTAVAAV
ncbi:MAG TPA: aldehyde dehydrogenase family protein, partial [Candidatus Sulfomarinibacteraceae bacterium]|nr:aldehyde dehydrogenase family protein [Candidatus Sulfomarinibacteraceae bacterium]